MMMMMVERVIALMPFLSDGHFSLSRAGVLIESVWAPDMIASATGSDRVRVFFFFFEIKEASRAREAATSARATVREVERDDSNPKS